MGRSADTGRLLVKVAAAAGLASWMGLSPKKNVTLYLGFFVVLLATLDAFYVTIGVRVLLQIRYAQRRRV